MKTATHICSPVRLRHCLVTLTAIILTFGAVAASQATLVFDNITPQETDGHISATSSTPNTFMGDGYNLLSGTIDITGFDLYPVNLSGTNFNALQLTIYVWGGVNTGTVNAATPAFSNLLGTFTFTATGTFTTGFFFPFESASPGVTPGITLASPLLIPSTTIGLTFNYMGSTDGGTTYSSANSLTSLISHTDPPTVGSNVFNGYYRNANSETNGNFTSTLRSLGLTNQSLAVRVYGDVVPEPSTWLLIASGAGVLLIARRKRLNKLGQ
jgi:hypothetical protein